MSDFDKDKIVGRVRKMLAIANDGAASEGERDNAMRMAHATLAKYNLSLGDAEVKSEPRLESTLVTADFPWTRSVTNSIAKLYFCEHFFIRLRGGKVAQYFIGRESNVETARGMTEYVISSIRKEARNRARDAMESAGWERSFCKGAANALYYRCAAIRAEAERPQAEAAATGTSLVLASLYKTEQEKNLALIAATHGPLRTSKSRERNTQYDAHSAGRQYGNSISLNRQVGGGASSNPRLT